MPFIDFILHVDQYLDLIIQTFGVWVYVLLFLIIFFETGLVVTPFLPGDSLLFVAGAFAARGSLDLALSLILLFIAAVAGDAANYWMGNVVGPRIFAREKGRFFNREHLTRTQTFYERHGKKTIIIARFIPIIRTFAPFVAGVARMRYVVFATYNVVGAFLWVFLFVLGGYFFGEIPFIRDHFSIVIIAIIVLSLIPAIYEVIIHQRKK